MRLAAGVLAIAVVSAIAVTLPVAPIVVLIAGDGNRRRLAIVVGSDNLDGLTSVFKGVDALLGRRDDLAVNSDLFKARRSHSEGGLVILEIVRAAINKTINDGGTTGRRNYLVLSPIGAILALVILKTILGLGRLFDDDGLELVCVNSAGDHSAAAAIRLPVIVIVVAVTRANGTLVVVGVGLTVRGVADVADRLGLTGGLATGVRLLLGLDLAGRVGAGVGVVLTVRIIDGVAPLVVLVVRHVGDRRCVAPLVLCDDGHILAEGQRKRAVEVLVNLLAVYRDGKVAGIGDVEGLADVIGSTSGEASNHGSIHVTAGRNHNRVRFPAATINVTLIVPAAIRRGGRLHVNDETLLVGRNLVPTVIVRKQVILVRVDIALVLVIAECSAGLNRNLVLRYIGSDIDVAADITGKICLNGIANDNRVIGRRRKASVDNAELGPVNAESRPTTRVDIASALDDELSRGLSLVFALNVNRSLSSRGRASELVAKRHRRPSRDVIVGIDAPTATRNDAVVDGEFPRALKANRVEVGAS